MANIQAICSECGAHLTLDHEGARCPFCGTPIVMGHSGGYELSIRATLAEDGEAFMEIEDWSSAQKSFSRLIQDYPYDYRGWWGMAQIYSRNFSFVRPSKNVFETICDYANRAYKTADAATRQNIAATMRDYQERLEDVNAIGDSIRTAFSAPRTEAPKTSPERRQLERKVQELSESIEKLRSLPRRLAIIFGLCAFGLALTVLLLLILAGSMTVGNILLLAVLLILDVYVIAFIAFWVGRLIAQDKMAALKKKRKRLVREMENTK